MPICQRDMEDPNPTNDKKNFRFRLDSLWAVTKSKSPQVSFPLPKLLARRAPPPIRDVCFARMTSLDIERVIVGTQSGRERGRSREVWSRGVSASDSADSEENFEQLWTDLGGSNMVRRVGISLNNLHWKHQVYSSQVSNLLAETFSVKILTLLAPFIIIPHTSKRRNYPTAKQKKECSRCSAHSDMARS